MAPCSTASCETSPTPTATGTSSGSPRHHRPPRLDRRASDPVQGAPVRVRAGSGVGDRLRAHHPAQERRGVLDELEPRLRIHPGFSGRRHHGSRGHPARTHLGSDLMSSGAPNRSRRRRRPKDTEASGNIGIDDLKISVTPNLTADVAVNPDFAQTEIDEQRVNLTRFSLFFPEKRQFFLEGADSLRMGPPTGDFDDASFELFHSRRVGLSEWGEPMTMLAGAKLTGKVGGTDLGVFGARTGSQAGRPGETFGVARFRRELLGRSYVGAIATLRDGADHPRTTLGADARFVIRRYLTLSALAGSTDDGVGPRQSARFVSAAWDADLFSAEVAHLDWTQSSPRPSAMSSVKTDRPVPASTGVPALLAGRSANSTSHQVSSSIVLPMAGSSRVSGSSRPRLTCRAATVSSSRSSGPRSSPRALRDHGRHRFAGCRGTTGAPCK